MDSDSSWFILQKLALDLSCLLTVLKRLTLRTSLISEQDRGLEQMLGKTKFSDSSDSLVLEDESARVQLRGAALKIGELVTGLIVAVRGSAVAGGDFWVTVRFLTS